MQMHVVNVCLTTQKHTSVDTKLRLFHYGENR